MALDELMTRTPPPKRASLGDKLLRRAASRSAMYANHTPQAQAGLDHGAGNGGQGGGDLSHHHNPSTSGAATTDTNDSGELSAHEDSFAEPNRGGQEEAERPSSQVRAWGAGGRWGALGRVGARAWRVLRSLIAWGDVGVGQ